MKPGKVRHFWQMAQSGIWLCLLAGCALEQPHRRSHTNSSGLADKTPTRSASEGAALTAAESYRPACPDVLEVTITDQSPQRVKINADGRVDLGQFGQVRVEGESTTDIGQQIAETAHLPAQDVSVRVAEFNSQQVYLFGAVKGLQRSVPYRGRETVTELLHRAGGLGEGAEPNDVYVVRGHIADGGRPEVFPIPLGEDGEKKAKADLRLEPFDQVYVGEARQSTVCRGLPPCLRPFYEAFCWFKRTDVTARQ